MGPSKRIAAALLLVSTLAALPIALSDIVPLVDYPGHLVRVHLLAHWNELTDYDAYYRPAWRLLPNLALEFVAVPLAMVLPTRIALRIFCALVVVVLVCGGAVLNRSVTGRWTIWSLAPALLVYNHVFAYGFLNFLFGLGISLFALASHLAVRARPLSARVAREVLFALALFFCHIVVLASYVLAAAAIDAASTLTRSRAHWRELARDYGVLAAGATLPLLLFVMSPTRGEATGIGFSDLATKVMRVVVVFKTGQGLWDDLFAAGFIAIVVSLLATRQLRVHWPTAAGALTCGIFFVVAPYRIGNAYNVDTRLPVVVLFLATAALDGVRVTRAAAIILASLFVVRVAATTVHYRRSSDELNGVTADLAVIPRGAMVFTTREASARIWWPDHWNPPLPHASELRLLDQPFFSETLFTNVTQQPLVRAPRFASLDVRGISEATDAELDAYGERIASALAAAECNGPAYVYLLKGPRPSGHSRRFALVLNRPRYAVYRLLR